MNERRAASWLWVGVVLIPVAAWGFGFRFHPENISTYLPFIPSQKIFRKVDLKNGGSLVGILHHETETGVTLRTEGGIVGLSKDEIAKMTELDSKQASRERYWSMDFSSTSPLLTYRPEDGIFYDKTKKKSSVQGKGREQDVKQDSAAQGKASGELTAMNLMMKMMQGQMGNQMQAQQAAQAQMQAQSVNMMTALAQTQDMQNQVMARQEEYASMEELWNDEGDH